MDNGESSYRRFLDGDDYGMEELVRDYKDGLLLYINSYLKDLSIAEDCVQDTFIKLATKKPRFKGKCSFKTWLYSIGRNMALYYIRKHRCRSFESIDECENISAENDLERDYLIEEQRILLHRMLCRLKEEYRQVLYLVYFENFSNSEVGKIMGKSSKQTENLIYNARKTLRSELEKEGFDYEKL